MSEFLFDIDHVGDERTRDALAGVMRDLDWRARTAGSRSAAGGHENVVVVGNALRIFEDWRGHVASLLRASHRSLAVLAIVANPEDEEALPDLVALCNSSLVVFQCKVQRTRAPETAWLESFRSLFERVRESMSPDRLRSAHFVDGDLIVVFGDGVSRAVRWNDLPFVTRVPALIPTTLRASDELDAVVVDDEAGHEIDIDALVLRSLFDNRIRLQLETARDTANQSIGQRLREVRERHQLTQEQLAERTGIPQASLSRIETGTREPRMGTLSKYAAGLGVTLSDLLAQLA